MIQANPSLLNFDTFITRDNEQEWCELIDGELIDLEPTGLHEQVIDFLARKLHVEIDRRALPYVIPHRCLLRISETTAFRPDLIVLDRTQLPSEPLWQDQPIVTSGAAIKLIAEVVSTNWQNDYARKIEDYALLGVPEYWIVDYLGLGGREYIGNPKQPTLTVCQLVTDFYEKKLLRKNEFLISSAFTALNLPIENIFAAGEL